VTRWAAWGGGGLQRRLLALLLAPLLLLALLNTWFDYQLADSAAIQQDRQLLTLVPQLASAVQPGALDALPPSRLPAELADFFASRTGTSGYALLNGEGHVLAGEEWLRDYPPDTHEPEFSSQELGGVVYRIVTQRVQTSRGELTVRLADGANVRWQRVRRVWLKVVLPNILLVALAMVTVHWAVRRALQPLLALKNEVAGRSPRDLSALDAQGTPEEVRPLVLALNHLFSMVNAQAQSQRFFIADAAHQLRTPLAGLQAQVEALAQNAPAGMQEQTVRLRDATRRTSQLVQQLLMLSRLDTPGVLVHAPEPLDLKQLCEQVLEAHLDAAERRQIDFGLSTTTTWVEGDAWQLRELLNNLVDNAIKYTPPGGKVTLRCGLVSDATLAGAHAFVLVEDDGPGVAPDERARILQRFYRVAGSAGEGSGLGLAIADEIARAHHSQLQIHAGRDGRGLCVSLLLRAVRECAIPLSMRP